MHGCQCSSHHDVLVPTFALAIPLAISHSHPLQACAKDCACAYVKAHTKGSVTACA